MTRNQETCWEAYILLLKQGFELQPITQKERWGKRLRVRSTQQAAFVGTYFPAVAASAVQYTAHILVLHAGQTFTYASLKIVRYRIFSGKLVLKQLNGEREQIFYPGDEFRIVHCYHSLQAIDGQVILALVALNL